MTRGWWSTPMRVGLARPLLTGLVGVLSTLVLADEPMTVTFELNDAQVKNRMLGGVDVRVIGVASAEAIVGGTTGEDGRWTAELPAGTYRVAYRHAGYVPYTSGPTEIRQPGQLVVVSLSRMLEATSEASSRVRIILNWGSREDQVRDADSHLVCPCAHASPHVCFQDKVHEGEGHRIELDVDDTDWGGPETITLTDPPPGEYLYWVHDFSGPPALLGTSDVVVRVVIGDQEAGEFRVFRGVDVRAWRPFRGIDVAADGSASVLAFSADEIAEGLDLQTPSDERSPEEATTEEGAGAEVSGALMAMLLTSLAVLLLTWKLRRLQGRQP